MASFRKLAVLTIYIFIFSAALAIPSEAAYQRIVSLYPGHTDNIIALGGDSKLVGISESDEPGILPGIPRFTPRSGPEEIMALRPDLVILRTLIEQQNPELRKVLERAGIKVMVIDPPKWNDFAKYLQTLAPIVDKSPADATLKLNKLRGKIQSDAAKLKKGRSPRVFIEATEKELHTCAPDSWAANLIALAGGVNTAGAAVPLRKGSNIAPWGLERILKTASTGLDIYIVQQGAMNASSLESVKKRPWYPALKKVKVAIIPEYCLSRPSLLGLERGGAMIIKVFYGE